MLTKSKTSFGQFKYLLHNTENHDLMTNTIPTKWQQRNVLRAIIH